jgi:hypothetical protein
MPVRTFLTEASLPSNLGESTIFRLLPRRPRPRRLVRVVVTWVPVRVGKLEALKAVAHAEYEPTGR